MFIEHLCDHGFDLRESMELIMDINKLFWNSSPVNPTIHCAYMCKVVDELLFVSYVVNHIKDSETVKDEICRIYIDLIMVVLIVSDIYLYT